MSSGPGGSPERRDDEPDPLSAMFAAMFGQGGLDPEQLRSMLPPGLADLPGFPRDAAGLQAVFAQVQQMLAGGGDGPVNWDAAHDVARAVAAQGGDPAIGETEQRQVAEALRTADLWLDRVTELPSATARSEAWSRADWVEKTLPTWKGVVEPIASSVAEAMSDAMASQAPEEMRAMLGGALPMVRRMGGAFFGAQLGQALGALAREVVGAGDTGLPLLPAGRAALLPANVAAFGEGLGLDADEVRLYLGLREAAHARLMAGVPWLRAHLLGAVEVYARGITIDTSAIEEAVRSVDPTDPAALQEALQSGLFEPQATPAQRAALERLETALALVEGWIDEVVDAAAAATLPHREALRETVRRRRAAGGPAEHIFASLVGLDLRPRRLREAAAVWAALTAERGVTGRDALWAHPDLAPTAESFADPVGFAQGAGHAETSDLDAALEALLESPAEPDTADEDASAGDKGAGPAAEDASPSGEGGDAPPDPGGPSDDDGEQGGASGLRPEGGR
ncbi:MAG: zinc-dependent metalloprotease [Kineosporiaceae bacterium]